MVESRDYFVVQTSFLYVSFWTGPQLSHDQGSTVLVNQLVHGVCPYHRGQNEDGSLAVKEIFDLGKGQCHFTVFPDLCTTKLNAGLCSSHTLYLLRFKAVHIRCIVLD